jgi:hypothetical protein
MAVLTIGVAGMLMPSVAPNTPGHDLSFKW